jgi:hypothetical protein
MSYDKDIYLKTVYSLICLIFTLYCRRFIFGSENGGIRSLQSLNLNKRTCIFLICCINKFAQSHY